MSLRPVATTATRVYPRATARTLHPETQAAAFFSLPTRPYICPTCLQQQQQQQQQQPRSRSRRWLHATSRPQQQQEDLTTKNHYERLGLGYDASPVEIKKSFYALSKTHHPDTSPRPDAAQTFSLLSESYTVLSSPQRRTAYDRDVLHLHTTQPAQGGGGGSRAGSYSSTANRAGGRTASGLSKRRGSFRGPPPSFYRSGGWGAHSEKRRAAHEESTGGGPEAASQNTAGGGATGRSGADGRGGMGPGSHPYGPEEDEVPPHFDKAGHRRTQGRQDERRWQRTRRAMDDEGMEFEPQMSLGAHFLVVSAILAVTVMAPMAYLNMMRSGRRKKDDR